jgi:hypothetical protein
MQETKKQPDRSKTPERGTAEAAQKERGKPSNSTAGSKDGAASRGREPITAQNRTSSEE